MSLSVGKNLSINEGFGCCMTSNGQSVSYLHVKNKYTNKYILEETMELRNRCWGRRDRDRIVVGFTTTCAIIAYHH